MTVNNKTNLNSKTWDVDSELNEVFTGLEKIIGTI